jgi:hypothetical protein
MAIAGMAVAHVKIQTRLFNTLINSLTAHPAYAITGSPVLRGHDHIIWPLIGLVCATIGESRFGIDLHRIWAGFMRR